MWFTNEWVKFYKTFSKMHFNLPVSQKKLVLYVIFLYDLNGYKNSTYMYWNLNDKYSTSFKTSYHPSFKIIKSCIYNMTQILNINYTKHDSDEISIKKMIKKWTRKSSMLIKAFIVKFYVFAGFHGNNV